MKLGTFYGTATINNSLTLSGRLYVTQERIDISTSGPKADPWWTAVDQAGHFHAMSGKDYPDAPLALDPGAVRRLMRRDLRW